MAKTTRLRYIIAKDPSDLTEAIEKLPFKVEIKSIEKTGSGFIIFFVLPENENIRFNNLDLQGV